MHDMAERMHGALCRAWKLLLEVFPDGRLDRRDGYRVVSAPSFPVVPFNAVWVDGPDDHPAAHDLEASLASIAARGVAPGVITRDDRYPAVESEAGRLGLGLDEREVGMVLMPSGFRPPAGPGPRLVRVGQGRRAPGGCQGRHGPRVRGPSRGVRRRVLQRDGCRRAQPVAGVRR